MKNYYLLVFLSVFLSVFLIAAVSNPFAEENYPDSLPVLSKVSHFISAVKSTGVLSTSTEVEIFEITKEPVNVVKAKSGCEPRNIVNSGYFKLNSTYHWAIVTVQYPGPGCQWRYTYDNCSSP
ncbi:MAG: hypothetical protein ACK2U3_16840 [Anaerolineales bacterium]